MTNKELRSSDTEFTSNGRLVEGYAIVFNKESKDLGGFIEVISDTALDGVLEKSDVLCLLNHNEDRGILARCKYGIGSLTLEVDNFGLKYSFEAPETALGDELIENIKRGDITTSSFAFKAKGVEWKRNNTGLPVRIITQFEEIFDVSPVYKEAYPDTTVARRSLAEVEKAELEQIQLDKQAEELRKIELENELDVYFKSYEQKINIINESIRIN